MTQTNSSFTTPFALDDLDRNIIGLLKIDGRISFTEVSKRLNLPEATARYRVQRRHQQILQHTVGQVLGRSVVAVAISSFNVQAQP